MLRIKNKSIGQNIFFGKRMCGANSQTVGKFVCNLLINVDTYQELREFDRCVPIHMDCERVFQFHGGYDQGAYVRYFYFDTNEELKRKLTQIQNYLKEGTTNKKEITTEMRKTLNSVFK